MECKLLRSPIDPYYTTLPCCMIKQLKKDHDCTLKILMTALLESIDLFIAIFTAH